MLYSVCIILLILHFKTKQKYILLRARPIAWRAYNECAVKLGTGNEMVVLVVMGVSGSGKSVITIMPLLHRCNVYGYCYTGQQLQEPLQMRYNNISPTSS